SVGATLVPIPNTIVKPYSADGTPLERARESRPSPAPRGANENARACARAFSFAVKGRGPKVEGYRNALSKRLTVPALYRSAFPPIDPPTFLPFHPSAVRPFHPSISQVLAFSQRA